MPKRPQSPCVTPRCGGRGEIRGRCRPCAQAYEKNRGTAAERGYDSDWRAVRAAHLAAHPWCFTGTCRQRAVEVDHVVSVRVAPHRRLDPTNLRSHCKSCHSKKTVREDGGFGRDRVDAA